MAELGLQVLDRTVHDTNTWLKQVSEEMGHPDRQMAYHALRGVLFTLRDRLTVEEAAHLASQLPLLIRGIFYEGYKPSGKPEKYRDRDEWLQRVSQELQKTGGENPEKATRAVFAVLKHHLTGGELSDVLQMLPKEIRAFWPTEQSVAT